LITGRLEYEDGDDDPNDKNASIKDGYGDLEIDVSSWKYK